MFRAQQRQAQRLAEYTAPVRFSLIPEVASNDKTGLQERVQQLLQAGTGFILRGSVAVEGNFAIDNRVISGNAGEVARTINNSPDWQIMSGGVIKIAKGENEGEEFPGLGQAPIGKFHNDMTTVSAASNKQINVHTTKTGGGGVLLGSLGTKPSRAVNLRAYGSKSDPVSNPTHPHNLLLEERVDTRLVYPDMCKGEVGAGDSIVFMDDGPGAQWHRFDTDPALGERTASVFLCVVAPSAPPPRFPWLSKIFY